MKCKNVNHPVVVLITCFLWLTSIIAITWSLVLFFCLGEILVLTGTDLVNSFLLLMGLIMLPTNMHMLYSIANGRKIDYKTNVLCCPLWLCITWVIIIAFTAVILCSERIYSCHEITHKLISDTMKNYRGVPKYKRFMDNLQWSLKCCGLDSYRDWFSQDWYDKIRDYEWDPSINKLHKSSNDISLVTDSVPLSCCKSGSCVSNYLMELGTYSINKNGCLRSIRQVIVISMAVHLVLLILVILSEIIILKLIIEKETQMKSRKPFKKMDVRHIMMIKDNFDASSGSYQINPEDCEDDEEEPK